MIPLRALIVDDEPPARRWLRSLLANHPEVEIVDEAESVRSAREKVLVVQPDLVFLDIQMPPATGFDLLPHLPAETQIIFVTAYDSFAVKAFDANALDYLLKPVNPDRLAEAVARLQQAYEANQRRPNSINRVRGGSGRSVSDDHCDQRRLQLEDTVPLRDRDVLRMVTVKQIAAIQAEGAYTRILISKASPMMILHTISNWETRLPCPPFARLDRSRIVNLTLVRETIMVNRNQTLVTLGGLDAPLELGRAASQRLRQLLV